MSLLDDRRHRMKRSDLIQVELLWAFILFIVAVGVLVGKALE